MALRLSSNSRLWKDLTGEQRALLEHGCNGVERLLPHVEVSAWAVTPGKGSTAAKYQDSNRRVLKLSLVIDSTGGSWHLQATLQRRRVPTGIGATLSRTVDHRERTLASLVMKITKSVVEAGRHADPQAGAALRGAFDERVVAEHLINHHKLKVQLGPWFVALRTLAEQTYENKALSFGCILETRSNVEPVTGGVFPSDFLEKKKYRALSDGYRTAYSVSSKGAVLGFVRLEDSGHSPRRYYPEWSAEMASKATDSRLGLCLTRQGDLLVFDEGQLSFTYRFGRWQYWNHSHIVDLLTNAARVQHVPHTSLGAIARSIYRSALDVAFRRSGGLFVLLRSQNNLRKLVRQGDAIADKRRQSIDREFDRAVKATKIQSRPRAVLAELAALDGALVLNNRGDIACYGAILEPRKKGRIGRAEGSRTKAAIGASNYGLAVKVSSDGDITVYHQGKELLRV